MGWMKRTFANNTAKATYPLIRFLLAQYPGLHIPLLLCITYGHYWMQQNPPAKLTATIATCALMSSPSTALFSAFRSVVEHLKPGHMTTFRRLA